MSLCYDFQKWTIISLASVALCLTIGLIGLAYGYIDPEKYRSAPELYDALVKYNKLEKLYDYCYAHASDSANPIQDLIDKGLIDSEYTDCKTVKSTFDALDAKIVQLLAKYY
jgi:hypothetical protein